MEKDIYQVPITSFDAEQTAAINHFCQQFVTSGNQAQAILNAASNYPDNLLIQIFAAAFYLFGQNDQSNQQAKEGLLKSEKLLPQGNTRERMLFQAMQAWYRLDYELAITIFSALTELQPSDLVAAKFAEYMFYCAGQYYNGKRYLAMCERMTAACPDHANNPEFLAMHAFAAELSGEYNQALKLAEQAVTLKPETPWAHHALSHIYLLTADIESGIKVMEQYLPSWDNTLQLLKVHNTWHLALFYLTKLDTQKTNDLFKQRIWPKPSTLVGEQIDTIALLWRMEMAGMDMTDEWQDLVVHIDHHPYELYTPFLNIHYLYALVRANKDDIAKEIIANLKRFSQQFTGNQFQLWHDITIPLLNGIRYFALNDYQQAERQLAPIIERCFRIGGSDAQDELMTQMYLMCLIKNNKLKAAQVFFQKHLAHYQATPLYDVWFAS